MGAARPQGRCARPVVARRRRGQEVLDIWNISKSGDHPRELQDDWRRASPSDAIWRVRCRGVPIIDGGGKQIPGQLPMQRLEAWRLQGK